MNDNQRLVAQLAARILGDLANPQAVTNAATEGWKETLWAALEDSGLTAAWAAEEHGGFGKSVVEGFEVALAAGRFALSVSLTETMLASWLLSRGGIAPPRGMISIAPSCPQDRITMDADGLLHGHVFRVPFARHAAHIAVLTESDSGVHVAIVDIQNCVRQERVNLAGDACDDVAFDNTKPILIVDAPADVDRFALALRGSIMRSVQIAGGLQSILELTIHYANTRTAFGQKIGKFQMVQNNLARLAGEVAAASAVALSAVDAIANVQVLDEGVILEVLAAKIRCAEAAGLATAIAHQIHGAIGFTSEHVLHHLTLHVLSWRDDFGDESYWSVELGRRITQSGVSQLWALLATR